MKQTSVPWLPHAGVGLKIVGIGIIIVGISQILPGLVVFFLPGPAGVGPLSSSVALLEAVGGVGLLVVGGGLLRIGEVLRRSNSK